MISCRMETAEFDDGHVEYRGNCAVVGETVSATAIVLGSVPPGPPSGYVRRFVKFESTATPDKPPKRGLRIYQTYTSNCTFVISDTPVV